MSSKKCRKISAEEYWEKYDANKDVGLTLHSSATDMFGRFSGGATSYVMTCWSLGDDEDPFIKIVENGDIETGEVEVSHWLYYS